MKKEGLDCLSARVQAPPRNKQLDNGQSTEEIWTLARQGSYLTMKQLARITNFAYGKFTAWKRQGLPLIEGKIRYDRFVHWIEVELPQLKAKESVRGDQPSPRPFLKFL